MSKIVTIVEIFKKCKNCQHCQKLSKVFKIVITCQTVKNCQCWSGHVSSSLWSNVAKVTSLLDCSLKTKKRWLTHSLSQWVTLSPIELSTDTISTAKKRDTRFTIFWNDRVWNETSSSSSFWRLFKKVPTTNVHTQCNTQFHFAMKSVASVNFSWVTQTEWGGRLPEKQSYEKEVEGQTQHSRASVPGIPATISPQVLRSGHCRAP